jgi:hypothetical protein
MIEPPKPRFSPHLKPATLPKRNAVTIVAGFKSYEGVVLCADTQETVLHSKRQVPKLRFEPDSLSKWGKTMRGEEVTDMAAAFCGAGDGPFIDKLIDEAWKAAQEATSLQEAGERIEASITGLYREFGKIYQPGFCPQVDLIYGIRMAGRSKLFSAVGPVVNEKGEYYSAGQGYYMADFLARRMYGSHLTIHQCVIVAAYTLLQAKEHVDGCGGDSQIAVLRDGGPSGLLNFQVINAITKNLEMVDTDMGALLLAATNLDIDDKQWKEAAAHHIDMLQVWRENQIDDFNKFRENSLHLGQMLGVPEKKTDKLGLEEEDETIPPEPLEPDPSQP